MKLASIAKKWMTRAFFSQVTPALPWDRYHERMSQRQLADLVIPPEDLHEDVSLRNGQTRHSNSGTDQTGW